MSVFEPTAVIALLKSLVPGKLSDRKKFEDDWKDKVQQRKKAWIKARTTQSDSAEQMEWASNVVQYVMHMVSQASTPDGQKEAAKLIDKNLARMLPILGPRFLPPGYLHISKRSSSPNIVPASAYLKPLHIIHPFFYPGLDKCPQCGSNETRWKGWTGTGYREVHGIHREETALGVQLECETCKINCKNTPAGERGVFCITTTNVKFWDTKEHWEVPRDVPCFLQRCAVTRDLYNLIVETRLTSTSGGMAEHIKQLHLLEYHKTKLEYLQYYKSCQTAQASSQTKLVPPVPVVLQRFSDPWDASGYGDKPITDDLISDIYINFCERTRIEESQRYLRNLLVEIMSLDNTYKVASKAVVVDKDGKRKKLFKGGILSIINESNEIISWRFCQSGSPAEAAEMLKGIKARCEILGVPLPTGAVLDNCCTVKDHLLRVMKDLEIWLDVFHMIIRYLIVIIGGTKNPHRNAVAKDIRDAIIKTPSTKNTPATYWSKEEQAVRLKAAYEKWSEAGSVWSAAAHKTHLDQLGHVEKGCLARSKQHLRSDGSRIEGSHKGWNSIQRSFASGIELTNSLSHDFVLRRNCRVATDSERSSEFSKASHGCHHVHLLNEIAEEWNKLVLSDQEKQVPVRKLTLLPGLQQVNSGETFGLVESRYATSFKGLLEVKEEIKDEPGLDLSVLSDEHEIDVLLGQMNIDPALLNIPEVRRDKAPQNLHQDSDFIGPLPASKQPQTTGSGTVTIDLTGTQPSNLLASTSQGKRKAGSLTISESDAEPSSSIAKRARVELCANKTSASSSASAGTSADAASSAFKSYFKDKRLLLSKNISTPVQPLSSSPLNDLTESAPPIDVFKLPVRSELAGLTKSQRLFSVGTHLDVRSLTIKGDEEFYLFMRMRAERGWATFKMTPLKWVSETALYNARLQELASRANPSRTAISKNPRALIEKLAATETSVLQRIATNDYKSQRNSETFWREACSAVPLMGAGEKKDAIKKRKPATCKRCQTVMYPGSMGASENHKKSVCSDGAMRVLENTSQNADPPQNGKPDAEFPEPLDWPQPQGIFTNGTLFHPAVFLEKIREMYEKVVVDGDGADLVLEHVAFARLLARRTVQNEDGTVIFKLLDIECQPALSEALIVVQNGNKHLRLDCLQNDTKLPVG